MKKFMIDAPATAGGDNGHVGAEPVKRPVLETPCPQPAAARYRIEHVPAPVVSRTSIPDSGRPWARNGFSDRK